MSERWEPTALRELFVKLQDLEMIIIGGQAVNLWAIQYGTDEISWRAHLPFTSEDLDFLGGPAEVLACQKQFGVRAKINDGTDPSPNAGVILVPWRDLKFRIDILTGVFGLSTTDVEKNALIYEGQGALHGIRLKVLHPIHCLEGKAASLTILPQSGRQDDKHLRLSLLIMREFMQKAGHSTRMLLNLCERIFSISGSQTGRDVFLKTGLMLEESIPIDYLKAQPEFAMFIERRLPQLKEEVAAKRIRWGRMNQKLSS